MKKIERKTNLIILRVIAAFMSVVFCLPWLLTSLNSGFFLESLVPGVMCLIFIPLCFSKGQLTITQSSIDIVYWHWWKQKIHYDISEIGYLKCSRGHTGPNEGGKPYASFSIALEHSGLGRFNKPDRGLNFFFTWLYDTDDEKERRLQILDAIKTFKEISELTGLKFKPQESSKHFLDGSEFDT